MSPKLFALAANPNSRILSAKYLRRTGCLSAGEWFCQRPYGRLGSRFLGETEKRAVRVRREGATVDSRTGGPETRSDSLPPGPLGERGAPDFAPRSIVPRFRRPAGKGQRNRLRRVSGQLCAQVDVSPLNARASRNRPARTRTPGGVGPVAGWRKSVSHGDPIGRHHVIKLAFPATSQPALATHEPPAANWMSLRPLRKSTWARSKGMESPTQWEEYQ